MPVPPAPEVQVPEPRAQLPVKPGAMSSVVFWAALLNVVVFAAAVPVKAGREELGVQIRATATLATFEVAAPIAMARA